MKNVSSRGSAISRSASSAVFVFGLILGSVYGAFGQETASASVPAPEAKPATEVLRPAVTELRGVSLGMTKAEVKDKLGRPLSEDDNGLFYTFSNTESAQIGLNADGKVRTIALIYSKGDSDAPKFQDIFGPDVQVAAADNGRIYKMVRYPAAGFWLAYSKIGEDKDALTTVTMKKIGDN